MLSKIGAYFLTKLATEAFLKRVAIVVAEHLAKKTETKLDDEVVAALKEALE